LEVPLLRYISIVFYPLSGEAIRWLSFPHPLKNNTSTPIFQFDFKGDGDSLFSSSDDAFQPGGMGMFCNRFPVMNP